MQIISQDSGYRPAKRKIAGEMFFWTKDRANNPTVENFVFDVIPNSKTRRKRRMMVGGKR